MHGAIYLVLKTDGDVQRMVKGWVNNTIIVFVDLLHDHDDGHAASTGRR